jgi:hypothetical protein
VAHKGDQAGAVTHPTAPAARRLDS